MNRPRLFISNRPQLDSLSALEFGRVSDGQREECWRTVCDQLAYLHDGEDGRVLGFVVHPATEFDPEAPGLAPEIWGEPRFDVPLLGLSDAPAGEIVLGVRALVGEYATVDRLFFEGAVELEGERALRLWLACLEAGDSMAHFALGYTLYELGRFHDAYRHLRHYTEIAPAHPWNWVWHGKAADAIGEEAESERAYERAIELEEAGAEETDAWELLTEVRHRRAA